jgi:1-acyl-sn-glycerol-3-phosphate acyltransferase
MPDKPSPQPKPVTQYWRPDLTRLAPLTRARLAFRAFAHGLVKFIVWLLLDVSAEGLENFPKSGPALVVINHLGDADVPALFASLPYPVDALAKIELYDLPVLGRLMDWYGVIWLHRGRPDKRALRAALDGLSEGRVMAIAPEGRYSLTGALEEGNGGAAFLAYKSEAMVVPISLAGTENENVYGHIKKLRRASVQLRVGKPFKLAAQAEGRRETMDEGTRMIMQALAGLLPERYHGAYSSSE